MTDGRRKRLPVSPHEIMWMVAAFHAGARHDQIATGIGRNLSTVTKYLHALDLYRQNSRADRRPRAIRKMAA
jgi:hypothetical protein